MFSALKAERKSLRLVILSPLSAEPHFVEEFADDGVVLERMVSYEPGPLERRVIRILQEKFVRPMPTASMRVRVGRAARAQSEIRYLDRLPLDAGGGPAKRALLRALVDLPIGLSGWFALLDRLTLGSLYADLFAQYRPNLVVTPTSGLYFSEGPLLARARRNAVPTMAIDLSWDHFTTKTAPLRPVGRMCVWNEQMRGEAVRLHGYSAERVFVTGVPQFDHYSDRAALGPRPDFLETIGAAPNARLVTLTTVPPILYPGHAACIERLLEARACGALGDRVELLVRVHQRDDKESYRRFEGIAGLHLEKPFRETISAEGSTVDPSRADRLHLARTLFHSDVIVNVASTIALEAAIMDTPVVNIGFDMPVQKPYLDSAARFYDYTHYRPLVSNGAVRVASSPDELVRLVREELDHPARGQHERLRVSALLAYKIDGKSSERVAERILQTIRSVDN
jgi:hypothetical protein